jgi:hypothetical protein
MEAAEVRLNSAFCALGQLPNGRQLGNNPAKLHRSGAAPQCFRHQGKDGNVEVKTRRRLLGAFGQALGAIAADFRARHGHLHMEVPRDLFFQLFV